MNITTRACALILGSTLFMACSHKSAPSLGVLDRSLTEARNGAFGKFIEHSDLSADYLDNAQYFRDYSRVSENPSDSPKWYKNRALEFAELAIKHRTIAEEAFAELVRLEVLKMEHSRGSLSQSAVFSGLVKKQLFFATGSSTLSLEERKKLTDVVEFLSDTPEVKVRIVGYTDTIGSHKLNQELSSKRAVAVTIALKRLAKESGVDLNGDRIGVVGLGEASELPNVADQNNRRVDVVIVK